MTKPLALTDRQLRLIEHAAKAVPPRQRAEFLENVAKHLASEPSDAAVQAAVNSQLDPLSHRYFMCDSAPNKSGD